MKKTNIVNIVDDLSASGGFSTDDLATRLEVSRQAAHRHIRRFVQSGYLVARGRARAVRYWRPDSSAPGLPQRALASGALSFSFDREGLAEDEVWARLQSEVPSFSTLSSNAQSVFRYAFTELLNNAIDHSHSERVNVACSDHGESLEFAIVDSGIGALDHIRTTCGLTSNLDALVELSKGKMTTAPDRHTGEGIFFSSKVADVFVLESGALRWVVDRVREDQSVGISSVVRGTVVRFRASKNTAQTLKEVFDRYTENFEFTKTTFTLKLLTLGTSFISRSEAKRMLNNLDKFKEVTLDFNGVTEVGQGFVDEVFRVWANAYPGTRLIPIHMNEAVEFMVRRGLPNPGKM